MEGDSIGQCSSFEGL